MSAGNLFLEKVLRTDPQVDARGEDRRISTRAAWPRPTSWCWTPSTPPRVGPGRFIFVNAVPRRRAHRGAGTAGAARPSWTGIATILVMRHVDLAKVTIEDALRIRPLAAGRPLVEAVGGPLIYALEEQDRKAIFIGFDLFKTDFPLRVAFPLILSNSLRWLHPSGARSGEPPVRGRAADSAAGAPRGRRGHRDDAERAERQGADHARHGELQRDGGGRRLLAVDAEGRDEDRRQSHGRRRVQSHASPASRRGRAGAPWRPRPCPCSGSCGRSSSLWPLAAPARRGHCSTGGGRARGALRACRRRPATAGPWPSGARSWWCWPLTLPPPDAAALGGPAERRVPARRVRQRQSGRPRARLSLRGRGGQAA